MKKTDDQLASLRHTAAHILAQAVLTIYPEAKLGIGPATEDGFYYDFDLGGKTFSNEDLEAIEKRMLEIVKADQQMTHEEVTADEMIGELEAQSQPYKVELAQELKAQGEGKLGKSVMVDKDGQPCFTDLCGRPHAKSTKEVKALKLLKVAGAYWRGDEKRPMLQRIYGTAFMEKAELAAYLDMLKLAEQRDHRKLGQELDLFTFSDLVGAGLPMFTPRGTVIRREIEKFLLDLQIPRGYQQVWIPHLARKELYITSGHWEKFSDNIFHVSSAGDEEASFVLKPMNCPHHVQIYASRPRSYRELPIRYFEVTAQYRDEKPGQLHGLSRVRSISIDDAHCFCRPDQVEAEANLIYDIIEQFYQVFQMELTPRLSLSDPSQPDKYIGSREVWDKAEGQLRSILKSRVKEFEEIEGEAAFYGPKIDFEATDALGRKWQLATIQLDFNLPERFELEYTADSGERVRPVMIHRAIAGSFERFMSILIESYGGAFPLWLAPVQVVVATVSEQFAEAAEQFAVELRQKGIRVSVDTVSDSVGKKVRNAEKMKVPYVLVFGEQEASGSELQIRSHGNKETEKMSREKFIDTISNQAANRA